MYREYLSGQDDLIQQAIDKTERAWNFDKRSYIAANNLGFMYFDAESLDKAVQYWKQAYDLNSTDSDILAGYGLGLYAQGHTQEGLSYFRRAVLREPKLKNSEYLKTVHSWSQKAVDDATPMIKALTTTAQTQTSLLLER